jgi:hypothetical protein
VHSVQVLEAKRRKLKYLNQERSAQCNAAREQLSETVALVRDLEERVVELQNAFKDKEVRCCLTRVQRQECFLLDTACLHVNWTKH